MNLLPVAVTMGDPTGIGPEIVIKLFSDPRRTAPLIVIGDPGVLERAAAVLGDPVPVIAVDDAGRANAPGGLQVIAESALPDDLGWGHIDARAGRAAFNYVRRGVELAMAGKVAALVTAPLNKEALCAAGVPYPGHTEIIAELSGSTDYTMMMVNDDLRIVLVTIHQALRDAIAGVTIARVHAAIRLAHVALQRAGFPDPRIAVAGLNPHAGENGLMGREDRDVIGPAVAEARATGIAASGPWPADTVFLRARTGEFDVVVAQYHDQGLIPIKYLGLERGVNITIGLPFVRTSVDHGTAFDIAGTGQADHTSLLTAFQHALELTRAAV